MELPSTLSKASDEEVLRRHGLYIRHMGENFEPGITKDDGDVAIRLEAIHAMLDLANDEHPVAKDMWDKIVSTLETYKFYKSTLIRG